MSHSITGIYIFLLLFFVASNSINLHTLTPGDIPSPLTSDIPLTSTDVKYLFGKGTLASELGKALVQREYQLDDNSNQQNGLAEAISSKILSKKAAKKLKNNLNNYDSGEIMDPLTLSIASAISKSNTDKDNNNQNANTANDIVNMAYNDDRLVAQGGLDNLVDIIASAIVMADEQHTADSSSGEVLKGEVVPPPPLTETNSGGEDGPDIDKILAEVKAKEEKAIVLSRYITSANAAVNKTHDEITRSQKEISILESQVAKLKKKRLEIYVGVRKKILEKKQAEETEKNEKIEKDLAALNKLASKMLAKKLHSEQVKKAADLQMLILQGKEALKEDGEKEEGENPSQSGEMNPSQSGEMNPSQSGEMNPSQPAEASSSQSTEMNPSQSGEVNPSQSAEASPSQVSM